MYTVRNTRPHSLLADLVYLTDPAPEGSREAQKFILLRPSYIVLSSGEAIPTIDLRS